MAREKMRSDVHTPPGLCFSLLNLTYPTFSRADGRAGAGSRETISTQDRRTFWRITFLCLIQPSVSKCKTGLKRETNYVCSKISENNDTC